MILLYGNAFPPSSYKPNPSWYVRRRPNIYGYSCGHCLRQVASSPIHAVTEELVILGISSKAESSVEE
jgi:hypothetical protein